MNEHHHQLIKWRECTICNESTIGRKVDWTIMKGQLLLPSKSNWPHGEMAFIKLVLKNSLGKQQYIKDRLSNYSFIKEHWGHSQDKIRLISWNDYNDYWDNFNHHGIWIFDYFDDPKEMKRIRFEVLKQLGHYNE